MRTAILILVYVLVSNLTMQLQAQNSEHVNQIYTVAQLEEDLLVLRDKYEGHLTNLFLYNTEEYMNYIFDSLNQHLTPMNEAAFFNYITPLLSIIKDGHSTLFPSTESTTFYNTNSKFFPFQIVYRADKMFVIRNISQENNIAPGSEIISINGEPVSEILKFLLQHQVSDGYNNAYALWIINSYFRDFYSYSFGHAESYTVVINTPENVREEITIKGLTKDAIEAVKKERFEAIPLQEKTGITLTAPASGIQLLTIKTWDDKMLRQTYGQRFKPTIKNIIKEIENSESNNLIIDLRDNQGGNTKSGIFLLSHLLDKNFIYVHGIDAVHKNHNGDRKIKSKKSNMIQLHKPIDNPYIGKVTVLINGGSFSNSAIFASRIQAYERGKIIGEESGGNAAVLTGGFGITGQKSLPNTEILYSRANYRIIISAMESNTGRGVYPDNYILPSVDDLLQKKDAVLNYCIEHSISNN